MSIRKITPEDLVNLDNSYTFEWMKERGYTGGGFFSDDGGATPLSNAGETRARFTGDLYQVSVNGSAYQTIARGKPHVFNVLDFGADPKGDVNLDGDSAPAINAAIKAALIDGGATFNSTTGVQTAFARGGSVYIPAGTYNIQSTIFMGGSVGFKLFGDGPTVTRVNWTGTTALNRWVSSTGYSTIGQRVTSHGCSFTLTTAGTSSASVVLGAGTSSTIGTSVTDGTCVWTCNGYDKTSDMVKYINHITCGIEGIEFSSAYLTAIGVPTSTPRAVICSLQDGSNRLLSNTGFYVRDVNINWSGRNSGFNTQHDIGIIWDYCNNGGGVNNSEGFLGHVQMNGAITAGIQIWGAESQDHTFYNINIPNTNGCSIQTVDGGSFSVRDSNINCTQGTGTVIILGAVNDRILIDHCITEQCGRYLITNGNFGAAGWPVTIRNSRIATSMPNVDGQLIIFKLRGPLLFENNQVEGGLAGVQFGAVVQTSGNAWPAIFRDNNFSWSTIPAPGDNSFIQLGQGGVVETNNLYRLSNSDTSTRLEHGTLVAKAAPAGAWTLGTMYSAGNRVSANGNTYVCVTGGTAGGTGGSPAAPSHKYPTWKPEADGTLGSFCSWNFVCSATDGTAMDQIFEVPHFFSSYSVMPIITTRTGSSAASITITSLTKTIGGFSLTLSAAPTGSDTLTIDWMVKQG